MNKTMRKQFSRAVVMLLLMLLTATTAWATTKTVTYKKADGSNGSHEATVLTGSEIDLAAGWYLAEGNVSFDHQLNASGDVHIILKDNAVMNIGTAQSPVSDIGLYGNGHSISIYAQSTGNSKGQLLVNASQIGIFASGGNVEIFGGKVTATPAINNGYGIYAKKYDSSGGSITLKNATVTAKGGCAIEAQNGDLTAEGCTITATGTGTESCGIFTIYANITLTNCEVTATGFNGILASGGNVEIFGGKVTGTGTSNYGMGIFAKKYDSSGGSITMKNATVTAKGGYAINAPSGDLTAEGCTITATSTGTGIESYGIHTSSGNITLTNCEVTAAGSYGIYSYNGNVEINGGEVTATNGSTSVYANSGIAFDGSSITVSGLCYTRSGDFIIRNHSSVTSTASGDFSLYNERGSFSIIDSEVKTKNRIYSQSSVIITNATVNVESDNGEIYANNNGITIDGSTVIVARGIYAYRGELVIRNHSKITGNLESNDDISISDSEVEFMNRILANNKDLTIDGSIIKAIGNDNGTLCSINGNVILSLSNLGDLIYAKFYESDHGSVVIAEGKTFIDEYGNRYSGTLYDSQTPANGRFATLDNLNAAIGGKTLYPCDAHFSQSGNEYTIYTAIGWNAFCNAIDGGETFSGKTVKLGADIGTAKNPITRMAGSSNHGFGGTFDGKGHKLTISYGSSSHPITEEYTAPFRYTGGNQSTTTIKNLIVAGDIYTSRKFAAGFVSYSDYILIFDNCLSSVTIHSSVNGDGTHGGFVGNSRSSLYIMGSAFTGKLLTTNGTTHCGGFVGWCNGSTYITNCLYAPTALASGENGVGTSESATFGRRNSATISLKNCYYLTALGTPQGKLAHSIKAGEKVTVAFSSTPSSINIYSGITAYAPGLKYGNVLYAGSGEQVSLTLGNTPPSNYVLSGYTASNGGTLEGSDNPYTLTMPNANVVIGATFMQAPVTYLDADGNPQQCTNYTVLTGNETMLSTAGWYVVDHNISYTGTLQYDSDINLILCDGATMNIGTSSSRINGECLYDNSTFNSRNTLTIYGQSQNTGTLSTYTKGYGSMAIYAGTFVINGGHIIADASGAGGVAIFTTNSQRDQGYDVYGDITINGGIVEATSTGTSGSADAIRAAKNFRYYGGIVTASSATTYAINLSNLNTGYYKYYFKWRKTSDRITIGSGGFNTLNAYSSNYGRFLSTFVDDDGNIYTDYVSGTKLATLAGKTLTPYVPNSGYYLVGTMTDWGLNVNNKLTINSANTNEYMIQNVPLSTSDQFKVVYSANGTAKTTWYPDQAANYGENGEIGADGIYNIYFRPNGGGGSDWFHNCIYVQRTSANVTFAPEGFATYYNSMYDIELPAGVKARIVTSKGSKEGTLTYETIADGDDNGDKVVPAGTAVMLQTAESSAAQQKTLLFAKHGDSSPAAPTVNYLHGQDYNGLTTGDGLHYKLTYSNNDDNFGWYWGANNGGAFTSPGHKAWLVVPASAARSFFGLPDDATTTSMLNAERLMLNEAGAWYTINGVKLDKQPTQKGVYIYGGRKVVVK